MSSRTRVLSVIPVEGEVDGWQKSRGGRNVIQVELRYALGGTSYLTGQAFGRGYYVGATPQVNGDGFTSFLLFSGIKTFVQPATRFSAKVLANLVVPQETIDRLVAKVIEKNNLTLAPVNTEVLA